VAIIRCRGHQKGTTLRQGEAEQLISPQEQLP
jgi:hypothetical protein